MDTNYDLNANIDFITKNTLSNHINKEIKLQDKIMNSKDFNTTYQYIEEALNFMYEKSRTLQDIISYSKLFLENETNESIAECKKLINLIEKDKDLMKNKTYIKIPVPFDFSLKTLYDRNNSILPTADLYNNRLTLSNKNITKFNFDSFTVKNSSNCLFTNYASYKTRNNYRSLYALKNISSKAIKDLITIQFKNPITINKLNIDVSNCSIDKITISCKNKNYEDLNINNLNLFEEKTIDEINISISTKNYSKSQLCYSDIKNIDINTIIDSINSDQDIINKDNKFYYYYLFGIDNIEIEHVNINDNSTFYSKDIHIGTIAANEHISLYTKENIIQGSVEYYIINNNDEIPILPENTDQVIDEKIFYKTPTRFPIDYNKPIVIKKNLEPINISVYDVQNINDNNLYTISYTPIQNILSDSLNENIKIKTIIRTYNPFINNSIESINIKKYGGNDLWTV